MKTHKNILIAFLLNLLFSLAELIGGLATGSMAILSDAFHDFGDATAIALALILEKKSLRPADDTHPFGYGRYSVMGACINAIVLLFGSCAVIIASVHRLLNPASIYYDGMIGMAIFGIAVNFLAAWITHDGASINQKAVNLHMLEDVLGWAVVLIGAIVMRFTNLWILDPVLSIAVASYILIHGFKTLKSAANILLEKVPHDVSIADARQILTDIDGITQIHGIYLWTLDGVNHLCCAHISTDRDPGFMKEFVRKKLSLLGICHAFLEIDPPGTPIEKPDFNIQNQPPHHHHHA